jgi:glutamate-1-semialdehyde 2,1-aminomutase
MHVLYGLEPDIVLLGKAMGNGYPISAIVGKKQVMQAAQETFISSTYWTERIGFAAALAVIHEYPKRHTADHLAKIGEHLMKGIREIIKTHRLQMDVHGLSAIPIIGIHEPEPLVVKSVFTQEMLRKGFLASNVIYVSLAHTKGIVDRYLGAAQEVLGRIKGGVEKGCLKKMLKGPVCHAGFKRLTSKK